MRTLLLPVAFLLSLNSLFANAQFGNIFEMFGHAGDQHHHQQQQQRPTKGHSPTMWASQADAVGCPSYLCPSTLVCVDNPSDCPCPSPQDIKCIIPDSQIKATGAIICMSGTAGCKSLERFQSI
ncbi:uncharacterized protein EI90DRAFT_2967221 [Cantharellus anzutake]|uniref:uncharacterized protein n=1 Tax=Cantharellus anzutake TaxID=1750568 RepID=UPI0019034E8C|nr:uncharacterized protein EI90DRAFT_2967221 [Cantharellus anzutake]KAF8338728.1 hypothetical protein EI90DRAFT_2967221 [Cantharellus anzutake]